MSGMVVGFRLGLCGRLSEEGPMIHCTCDPAKKTCSIIWMGASGLDEQITIDSVQT